MYQYLKLFKGKQIFNLVAHGTLSCIQYMDDASYNLGRNIRQSLGLLMLYVEIHMDVRMLLMGVMNKRGTAIFWKIILT